MAKRGESLVPKKRPGSAPKLDDKAMRLMEQDPKERPFVSLQERCDYIEAMTGLSVSRSTMRRAIARIGPTWKEGTSRHRARRVRAGPLASDGNRMRWNRRGASSWTSAGHTHLPWATLYGYAPRGERLRLWVPRRRGKNTTPHSSMTVEG